jgi:multiple sugar transport system substrate-binding protein
MIKAYSGTDQMIALPYTLGFRALYYNRDIFDKFGVPYPHAKMSWEDTIQLARKVTRTDGGVQYYGFGFGVHPFLPIADEMGLPYVDAKTNKTTVNTAQWKTVFDQAKEFYDIPGNKDALNASMNKFNKEKTMAMIVANNAMRNFIDINWDTTSVPTLKSDPNNGGEAFGVALAVSAQSKHKEAAFAVILNTVSDEMQVEIARAGRPSVLKGDKYVQAFGKGMSNVTNQHLSEILSVTFKKPKPINKYDSYAQKTLRTKFNDTVNKGTDTNTALRDANEDIDKYIQTDLSGGK